MIFTKLSYRQIVPHDSLKNDAVNLLSFQMCAICGLHPFSQLGDTQGPSSPPVAEAD